MTADVQRELAEALPESLGPVGLRRRAIPALGVEASVTGYGLVLLDALLPTVQALIADAEKRAAAKALNDAADEFFARLPDGTGNGRAYNSHAVGRMLRDRAAALDPA